MITSVQTMSSETEWKLGPKIWRAFGKCETFCTACAAQVAEASLGTFMHLGTRQVLDDLFSDGPLRSDENERIHARSDWDGRSGVASSLSTFVVLTFFFSAACVGLPASNGLVTPSFAIGAGVGRLFGEGLKSLALSLSNGGGPSPLSHPGGYAIVGAAAFSVAVTGKISIGVVICELTGQLSYSIPVLFACVVGLAAGSLVEIDIYSMIAKMRRLPHWPTLSAPSDFELTVADVFDETHDGRRVACLRTAVPLRGPEGDWAAPTARLRRALDASLGHSLLPGSTP